MRLLTVLSVMAGVIVALMYNAALAEGRAPPEKQGAAPTAPHSTAHQTSERTNHSGWRVTVEDHDEGARTVLTASPRVARATGRLCIRRGLVACLKPIRASYLISDCRDQRVPGKRLGRQLLRAANTQPNVRIVTETGGYPYRCEVAAEEPR